MRRTNKDQVESLLGHYLREVWTKAGLRWDSDNYAEVGQIADAVEKMIDEKIAEGLQEINKRLREETGRLDRLSDRFARVETALRSGDPTARNTGTW